MHHLLLASTRRRSVARRSRWRRTGRSRRPPRNSACIAHPGARVYVLPCIAGHVGADTAGVILAEEPHEAERMTLVVDVGTNAEIVLGDKRRLLAASSPTGPAFEGAQISGGQRAAPGAIERVRIDREHARAALPGHRRRRLVRRAGLRDGVADTGITGICGSGIIEVVAEMFLAGIVTEDGVIDGGLAARTPRDRPRRPDLQLRPPRGRTGPARAAHRDHPERRPRDPAGQGRALRRRPAADGPARDRRPSTRSGWPARSAARSTRSTR